MKNVLLSTLFLVAFVLGAFGQQMQIQHEGQVIPSGSTITIPGDPSQPELVAELSIKNLSTTDTMMVKCRKIVVDTIPGTSNYFCWAACFPSFVYLSPTVIPIFPNTVTNEFSGHYEPKEHSGITRMCYSFFDTRNVNDSVFVYVEFFASGIGIDDTPSLQNVTISNPYPNPASSRVNFDYQLPANARQAVISVHSLLGSKVKEIPLLGTSGKVTFDVNDLKEGIYFYSIVVDNNIIATKRLVVSR
jgi:hypothetical protein